jgi:integrase
LNEWDLKAIASAELEKIEWAIPLFPIKGIYGEANQSRIRAFTLVLRWTGLRIRDVVRLQPNAVRNSYVVLRAQKNGKLVKILVPQIVTDELRKIENGSEYYFWSGLGNPKSCVGDWQRTLRRLSEISGVHIHAHRWRHTFATDLLSKGVPVSEVAALLGNSIRIVEKHYNQFIQARQDALDEAVKKTWV